MNEEQKLKVEEFFKNRPPVSKPIVQKMIADRGDDLMQLKPWIKELSARIANHSSNSCNLLSVLNVVSISLGWKFHSEQPSQRNSHASVMWRDRIIVFGGYDLKGISSNALTFDAAQKSWNKVAMRSADHKANPSRYAHKTAIVERHLYVFGGYAEEQGWLNDLCKVSLENDVMRCDKVGRGGVDVQASRN